MKINSETKMYCLLGESVSHSYSPIIYNYLFNYYNLNYKYLSFNVRNEDFNYAIKGIKALGAGGINITSPYKEIALNLVDEISDLAKRVQNINTVNIADNKLFGYNTDYYGVAMTFKQENLDLKGRKAIIFGSGSVAKTIFNVLQDIDIGKIIILNRTIEKAESISSMVYNKKTLSEFGELNNDTIKKQTIDADILINSTGVDLFQINNLEIDLSLIKSSAIFFDLIYNPKYTSFLGQARDSGFKIINGEDMLIYQALEAFKIWTGIDASDNYGGIKKLLQNKE